MAARITPSGGPKGDKLWRDALSVALKRTGPDNRPYLARIAEKCVMAADNGDMAAIKEIGDRLDGKPHQSMEVETTVTKYVISAKSEKQTPETWQQQHAPESKTLQ